MNRKGVRWVGTAVAAMALLGALSAPVALASKPGHRGSRHKKPAPAHATFQIDVRHAFALGGRQVTVPGRPVTVAVLVRPFKPHQRVAVRLVQGSRVLESKRPWLQSSASGGFGWFKVNLATSATGKMRIELLHRGSSKLRRFSHFKRLDVLSEQMGFGSGGRFIQLMQQRMAALHLYIPQTGVFDDGMALALDAYHRLLGWGPYSTLDGRTVGALLRGSGAFTVRFPSHGRHAEAVLSRHVLALIDGSHVEAIFPISSGKPSTPTILGDFHVYSRVPGYLPDGMYYSDVFYGNYAIHGYNPAPDYAASHGCIRLPIVDAIWVYNWLALGDWVDVYN